MILAVAMQALSHHLEGIQDPDTVTYTKQWDELGLLKGWWVTCEWDGESGLLVSFDFTQGYARVIGDLEKAPKFIRGKHQQV